MTFDIYGFAADEVRTTLTETKATPVHLNANIFERTLAIKPPNLLILLQQNWQQLRINQESC
jgi:hypothetical protein